MLRHELDAIMAEALARYDDDVRAAWARIRIEPARWRCATWGDQEDEFWAVAVEDGRVLWFNEIEDGFNWSPFSEPGTIDRYGCDQDSFEQILERIALALSDQAWASLSTGDVPTALVGPGTIEAHQTTYWDLRSANGARFRAHFRDRAESRFVAADFVDVALYAQHPVLVAHNAPPRSLYFVGAPLRAQQLAESLDQAIRDASGGWRGLADYASGVGAVVARLRSGHGLLMEAPEPVCISVASVLEAAGVQSSVIGIRGGRGRQALVLGRNFVVASAFAFEPRDGQVTAGPARS